jgi:hypothetical protein
MPFSVKDERFSLARKRVLAEGCSGRKVLIERRYAASIDISMKLLTRNGQC